MSTLFSRKCNVSDLLSLKPDDLGYIEGKVFMSWPPRRSIYRIQLEVAEQSDVHRFQVEIPYQHGMVFRPHEHVSLSLKGAMVEPCQASSAPHAAPIALRYPNGVALHYLTGHSKGKVIDTWKGHVDEWYSPGPGLVVSKPVAMDTSVPPRQDATVPSFIPASHLIRSMPQPQNPTDEKSPTVWREPRKKRRLNELRSLDAATPNRNQLSEADVFTNMSDLQKGACLINIIGIVSSASPERRTKTNEWSRSFTVIDESIVHRGRPMVVVNCFQKKHVERLPQVNEGDVVVLRNLKVSEFKGALSLIGYADRLQWAVYDPEAHSIRPPNRAVIPDKEKNVEDMDHALSPYWKPKNNAELERCREIGEWWRNQRQPRVNVPSTTRRRHLPISEASPDLPPGGFFNCTVEVLKRFENNGHYTVYVTDYTANPLVYPITGVWCPPQLYGYVLQCTMWDEARIIADMMKPGEYWYLNNVRAKWNPYHCIEGTMKLAEKVERLEANSFEEQPHLKALLERKYALGLGPSPAPHFSEMLLQDVGEGTALLTCVVELLSTGEGGQCIYVTDYTYNPDLPTTVSEANWAQILKNRVIKIALDDVQATLLSGIKPGAIVTIRALSIQRSVDIQGCLCGKDPLVEPVPDLSCEYAQRLLRRREDWAREILPVDSKASPPFHFDLDQALAMPAPGVFRVLARVSDFYPFDILDASVLTCPKCNPRVPGSIDRCPSCGDMMDVHGRWFYRLFVQLQDHKGNELIASLSGKECLLLGDVDPTDFRSNPSASDKLLVAVDPILGNLREVHEFWSRNESREIDTPLMVFSIESWAVCGEKAFGLLEYTPI